jgi:hypothetical protein
MRKIVWHFYIRVFTKILDINNKGFFPNIFWKADNNFSDWIKILVKPYHDTSSYLSEITHVENCSVWGLETFVFFEHADYGKVTPIAYKYM